MNNTDGSGRLDAKLISQKEKDDYFMISLYVEYISIYIGIYIYRIYIYLYLSIYIKKVELRNQNRMVVARC